MQRRPVISASQDIAKDAGLMQSDFWGEQQKDEITDLLKAASEIEPEPVYGRDKVAFVSREGFLVNSHLGEADYLYIIENFDGVLKVTDKRRAPSPVRRRQPLA